MTDNEITEAYFRARVMEVPLLEIGLGVRERVNILESNSAFTEHVLEVMEGENLRFRCNTEATWYWLVDGTAESEPIKSNNIPRAAVIAATRYWESKEVGKK